MPSYFPDWVRRPLSKGRWASAPRRISPPSRCPQRLVIKDRGPRNPVGNRRRRALCVEITQNG